MAESAITFIGSFWDVLEQMAPYLLFGFLVAGLLSVLVSPKAVERQLGGRGFWQVFKASLFGVPLPLCSCGVIPVAASLRRHGASKGATTSFLLSTPQTGVDSILVTFSMMGPVVAIFRPLAAFAMGIVGGTLVNLFGTRGGELEAAPACEDACCSGGARRGKIAEALHYGFVTLPADIGKSLLAGVAIAALISALVPQGLLGSYIGTGLLGMLVMMAFGIPFYVCATASVPIAASLMLYQGISPGAALVFLVTGPATNAATIATIWKVMGGRTAGIYLFTVAVSALASGLLLDRMLSVTDAGAHVHGGEFLPGIAGTLSAVALLGIVAYSTYRARRAHGGVGDACATSRPGTAELSITGMTCSHCAATVERALGGCAGVASAAVNLATGRAVITAAEGGCDLGGIKDAVRQLGYEVEDAPACGHDHAHGKSSGHNH